MVSFDLPMAARLLTRDRRKDSYVPVPAGEDGAEADIDATFRRKLAGLRRLSHRDRPHALRAARIERLLALKALRERRAYRRYAEFLFRRRQKAPAPG